jgi:putative FmdB family regulatory protein
MPLYEFECEDCGGFVEFREMEKRNDAARCPACEGPASRVVSAPFLAVMQPLHRQAAVRNERSQHEPRVGLKSSCCASGQCSHRKPARKPGEKPALQASTKKNRRPWMLGH